MKIFLSYAVAPLDVPIASVLRALAARYDISIILPDRTQISQNGVSADTQQKITSSDAVIALVTRAAPATAINVVNGELYLAAEKNLPVIALIESGVNLKPAGDTQLVYFNSLDLTAHEQHLETAIANLQRHQQFKQGVTALGWIAGITLGLIALSELVGEKE